MGEIADEWIYSRKHLSSPGRSCGDETDKIEAKLEKSGIAGKDELGAGKRGKRSCRKNCVNYMGGEQRRRWVSGARGRRKDRHWERAVTWDGHQSVSTLAYLGPVTNTYTARNTERYLFSILPFGVTAMRAAVGHLHREAKMWLACLCVH